MRIRAVIVLKYMQISNRISKIYSRSHKRKKFIYRVQVHVWRSLNFNFNKVTKCQDHTVLKNKIKISSKIFGRKIFLQMFAYRKEGFINRNLGKPFGYFHSNPDILLSCITQKITKDEVSVEISTIHDMETEANHTKERVI